MPGQDGTGPRGQGHLTGRGIGPCNRGFGFRRDFGRWFGRGFGWGYKQRFPEPLSSEEQKKILETELKEIEAEKQEIERNLNELKK